MVILFCVIRRRRSRVYTASFIVHRRNWPPWPTCKVVRGAVEFVAQCIRVEQRGNWTPGEFIECVGNVCNFQHRVTNFNKSRANGFKVPRTRFARVFFLFF